MKKQFVFLSWMLLCTSLMYTQQLTLVPFSSGYDHLVGIENCGDSRLFILEQDGIIRICDSTGNKLPKPFLDITDKVLFHGEQGLLGLAFDPNYAINGFFYVNYVNKSGNTQISRFRVKPTQPNSAARSSEKFILEIGQPFVNHNGGCTRFGPDGYLYIGMGDGGSGGDPFNNAQNPMSFLGKMLRIDVRHGLPYKIPPDNPFVDSSGYRPEIWAMGLRNPWRWSFDALDGSMYIADVGQGSWEEVDIQSPNTGGKNYGWHCYEGKYKYNTDSCRPRSTYDLPVFEYSHSSLGDCSITGGFVYRGTKYPALYGKYVFTDFCSGIFRFLHLEDGVLKVRRVLDGDNSTYTSFGEDRNRELYVCNRTARTIYHLTYGDPQQKEDIQKGNPGRERFTFYPNPSQGKFTITYTATKTRQVQIRIADITGHIFYSDIKTVTAGNNIFSINLHIPKGSYYLAVLPGMDKPLMQNLLIE
jgi:glucose/arabinose dehydrogenase